MEGGWFTDPLPDRIEILPSGGSQASVASDFGGPIVDLDDEGSAVLIEAMDPAVEPGSDVIEVTVIPGEMGEGIERSLQQGEVSLELADVLEVGGALGPKVDGAVLGVQQGDQALVGFRILIVIRQEEQGILSFSDWSLVGASADQGPEGGAAGVDGICITAGSELVH